MSEQQPVSWRRPIILAICALVLGAILAGRAFVESPPAEETVIDAEVE